MLKQIIFFCKSIDSVKSFINQFSISSKAHPDVPDSCGSAGITRDGDREIIFNYKLSLFLTQKFGKFTSAFPRGSFLLTWREIDVTSSSCVLQKNNPAKLRKLKKIQFIRDDFTKISSLPWYIDNSKLINGKEAKIMREH